MIKNLFASIKRKTAPPQKAETKPEPQELQSLANSINHSAEEMTMSVCGEGKRGKVKVQWVRRELDADGKPKEFRVPNETATIFSVDDGFMAAGKHYSSWTQLCAKISEVQYERAEDCYGRPVLYLRERFPCFDEFGYENEDRYYRWFYIKENNRLTCVYHKDDSNEIKVTGDVAEISGKKREEICKSVSVFPNIRQSPLSASA